MWGVFIDKWMGFDSSSFDMILVSITAHAHILMIVITFQVFLENTVNFEGLFAGGH